jgi:hypothetical protein
MADFTIFATAASSALGWGERTFIDKYYENRSRAHELILENSPLVAALLKLDLPIEGNATALMQLLAADHEAKEITKQKGYPNSVKAFSTELDRLAPNLREIGISIRRKKSGSKRVIRISEDFWDAR